LKLYYPNKARSPPLMYLSFDQSIGDNFYDEDYFENYELDPTTKI